MFASVGGIFSADKMLNPVRGGDFLKEWRRAYVPSGVPSYDRAYHLYLRAIAPHQSRHTLPAHARREMKAYLLSWDLFNARRRWRKIPCRPVWLVRLVCWATRA